MIPPRSHTFFLSAPETGLALKSLLLTSASNGGFSGEGDSEISETIDLTLIALHKGIMIQLSGCGLMHESRMMAKKDHRCSADYM